jgi:hypothetical protein
VAEREPVGRVDQRHGIGNCRGTRFGDYHRHMERLQRDDANNGSASRVRDAERRAVAYVRHHERRCRLLLGWKRLRAGGQTWIDGSIAVRGHRAQQDTEIAHPIACTGRRRTHLHDDKHGNLAQLRARCRRGGVLLGLQQQGRPREWHVYRQLAPGCCRRRAHVCRARRGTDSHLRPHCRGQRVLLGRKPRG